MGVILATVGSLAAIVLAVLSISANTIFGTLLTTGQERWLYAVLFGALDVLKTLLPLVAAGAFAAGMRAKGMAALLVFGMLTGLSLTASIGLYATTKGEMVGDAKAAHARYKDAVETRKRLEAQLASLGKVRPAGDIAGDIGTLRRDYRYDRSKKCTDATAADSRELCAKLDRLKGEATKAATATRLRREIGEVRGRLASMDVAAAMRAVDPQAEALARLASLAVPISPETVRTGLAVLVAVLVELGSGLGPWLVSPSVRPGPRQPLSRMQLQAGPMRTTEPVLEAEVLPGTTVAIDTTDKVGKAFARQWAAGAVKRRRGSSLAAGDLRAAYYAAADAAGVERLTPTAFGRLMTEMGYSREKVGGDQRYVDIALASKPAALPPPASPPLVDMTPAGRA